MALLCNFSLAAQDADSTARVNMEARRNEPGFSNELLLFVASGKYDMTGSAQNLLSVSRLAGRGLDALVSRKDSVSGFYKTKGLAKRLGSCETTLFRCKWHIVVCK